MKKKYKLTNDYRIIGNGHKVYRIKCVRDFGIVKKGELGGFIEKERNLSHEGNAWIGGDAMVSGDAKVSGSAMVCVKRVKEKNELEDYNRLKRMEKRINVYPDLRKAVRAAMEHEDGQIDLYLQQHNQSFQGGNDVKTT